MGCCIGKASTRQPPKPSDSPTRLPPPPPYCTRPSPPRPASHPTLSPIPLEEEAVKEVVLSQTPPLPPPMATPCPPPKVDDSPSVAEGPQLLPSPPLLKLAPQVFGQPPTPRKVDSAETDILISKLEHAADVVSEYSDMYTLSGSLSVSTTPTTGTAATLNDYEVTSKASWPVARTPTNKVPRRRPHVTGRDERPDRGAGSHARKLQQPPPERGRQVAVRGMHPGGVRQNAGQGGTDSRRRSSSPAQRRAGDVVRGRTGRSPSKRTGCAGNRSLSSACPGVENGSNPLRDKRMGPEAGKHKSYRKGVVRGGNENDDDACESLDNPHVSLECFIFL